MLKMSDTYSMYCVCSADMMHQVLLFTSRTLLLSLCITDTGTNSCWLVLAGEVSVIVLSQYHTGPAAPPLGPLPEHLCWAGRWIGGFLAEPGHRRRAVCLSRLRSLWGCREGTGQGTGFFAAAPKQQLCVECVSLNTQTEAECTHALAGGSGCVSSASVQRGKGSICWVKPQHSAVLFPYFVVCVSKQRVACWTRRLEGHHGKWDLSGRWVDALSHLTSVKAGRCINSSMR